jgi:hypothetical protein
MWREFSALEPVTFYNVGSNGNFVFVLRVLAIGAVFEELIKLVSVGITVGSALFSTSQRTIGVYLRTAIGYLCLRKCLVCCEKYEKQKIHIVA